MKHNFNKHEYNLINNNPEFQSIIDSIDAEYSMSIRKLTHEFGNALTLVNSSLQIIESSHPEVKRYKYWASTMGDVHYLVNLISELSFYNHSDKLNLETTNLVSLIKSVVSSYENTSENIAFNVVCLTSIPEISADCTKLKQVFINLIKNACEAIDSSEVNPEINIKLCFNNNFITISVEDNGQGISDEHIENIFSPMVSYKPNGTGLGLPISKKIIESHNGTINVESTFGMGTTFLITLPV